MKKKIKRWTYTIKSIDETGFGLKVLVEIYSPDYNKKLINGWPSGSLLIQEIFIPNTHPRKDFKRFLNSAIKLKIQLYLDSQDNKKFINSFATTQRIPVL